MSATIKLTRTMLDKHIIDANASVRSWALDAYGIDYASLREKVEVNAYVNGVATKVRFYITARGDRRVSIKDVKRIASVGDTVTLTKKTPLTPCIARYTCEVSEGVLARHALPPKRGYQVGQNASNFKPKQITEDTW